MNYLTFKVRDVFLSGVVVTLGSGVSTVQGFLLAFVGEVFEVSLAKGSLSCSYGIVVNLFRDDTMNLLIGALMLSPEDRISEGAKVKGVSKLLTIVVGDFSIGSMLDATGNLLLSTSIYTDMLRWVVESPAPGIIDRQSVFEPLQTGIIAIDALIPIGRGQRELVVGDRQTGKTAIGVDTILNQKFEKVLCVYVPIGQKASSILEVFLALVRRDSIYYLSLLVASASSSAVCQFLCSYCGAALTEFCMLIRELPCFLMYDDLSKHAVAYREIYLLLRRPPGREAYPGEIFFIHSRLLERSAKLSASLGGGSCSSYPVIETLGGDVSAYITTNLISITDGQIFLSIDLFLSGIRPAIDVGLSVSRVGSSAQWNGMKLVAGSFKLELAQFIELQAFSQFSSDLGDETKERLQRGRILVEMLKQFCGSPLSLYGQVGILSLANQDLLSSLELESVREFVRKFSCVPAWMRVFVSPKILARCCVLE
jgi:F-type H+-transporting ATPase subunit alpha